MPQAQPPQSPPSRDEFDELARVHRELKAEFERLQATVAQLKPIVDELQPTVQALQGRNYDNGNRGAYVKVVVGMTLAIVAALATIIVFVQTRS